MMLNTMKRLVVGGLVTLSLTGGSLVPALAGHAAAASAPYCPPKVVCPQLEAGTGVGSLVEGGLAGGVVNDGSKPSVISGVNVDGHAGTSAGINV